MTARNDSHPNRAEAIVCFIGSCDLQALTDVALDPNSSKTGSCNTSSMRTAIRSSSIPRRRGLNLGLGNIWRKPLFMSIELMGFQDCGINLGGRHSLASQ